MSSPMISVAGVRAIIGDSLIPEEFVKFTAGLYLHASAEDGVC